MGFTFIGDGVTALDRVRQRIGDTSKAVFDQKKPSLADEAITAIIAAEVSETAAALAACRRLMALYVREADTGTKSAGLDATRRFERLQELEQILLRELALTANPPLIGLSVSANDAAAGDSDRIQPPFTVGMMDL